MENNPELERAERELENVLRKERIIRKLTRKKYSISDYLIAFAVLFHFLAAIMSPFTFIGTLISRTEGARIPGIILWLILPAGLVSLGTAIGLSRVLDLPKPQTEQNKTNV